MREPGVSPAPLLLVTYGCSVGGCEMHLLHLATGLCARGWDVHLAYFRELAEEARSLVADFRAAGVVVHALGEVAWWHPAGWRRLEALVAAHRFAIVHSHLPGPDLAAWLVQRRGATPHRRVVSVHNERERGLIDYPRWLLRRVWGSADALVAISHGLGGWIAADVGVPRERITVVPYGLPPDGRAAGTSLRRDLGLVNGERLVVNVGRLVPQKGHVHLLDAMPAILRRVPDCHAVVVGHAQSDYGAWLRAAVVARGLADRVHLVGYREVGAATLAEADAFVFPSLWEGFGLAVIEAMAAGTPVVCTDVGPLPEVVGDAGLVAPARDPAALAAAVVRVLESPALAARLREAGRRRVAGHYGADAMVAATEAVYARVLGGGAAAEAAA